MTVMNRITMHHAASGYTVSKEANEHYHRMIDGDGHILAGKHSITDNLPGKLSKNGYAAHTLNLNSGNIGISILAMGDASWADPFASTKFPVRAVQVDALIKEVAALAYRYNIEVDPRFVLSHAEVQPTLGVKQKNKWDFDYDPRYKSSSRNPRAIGDELRQSIAREVAELRKFGVWQPTPLPSVVTPPSLMWGAIGDDVKLLQTLLNKSGVLTKPLLVDGGFGPKTFEAVQAYQRKNELLPDGKVGPLTWATLLKV